MKDDYKQISKIYDLLSRVYSLGAISRCRNNALKEVKSGMKVCFLGVGQGGEAVKAVELGAEVTVVDSSKSMLERFQKKMNQSSDGVKVFRSDVMNFCDLNCEKFDLVVSHFFLNVFPEQEMKKVLEKVSGLCSLEGSIVVGDFWHDREASTMVRWLQKVNWNVALFIFRLIADNSKHSIYLYDELLAQLGFIVSKEKMFNVLGVPMYRSIVAQKLTRDLTSNAH